MLRDVRHGEFVQHARERRSRGLTPEDRRLAQELAYGALRLRGRLDRVLEPLVRGGLEALEPDVLDVLRLAAYQLLELSRVPAYAAVSEAVDQTRDVGGRGAERLVNAVLRRVERPNLAAGDTDPVQRIIDWGSHPRWLLDRWLARWSVQDVERLVTYNNRAPPVYLRVFGDVSAALETLKNAGIVSEGVEGAPRSLVLGSGDPAEAMNVLDAIVQDPAASAVVDYTGLDMGERVADLCAAPGGKSAALAALGHTVFAFDSSHSRLSLAFVARERLGLETLHLSVADATKPAIEGVDAILIDAPCTGTGTLARHPDARWRLEPADLVNLVGLQARMLDAAATRVRPGGLLIYATCSLEPEENGEQVADFLAQHDDYHIEAPSGGEFAEDRLEGGALLLTPQKHGFDGSYAARLRRSK